MDKKTKYLMFRYVYGRALLPFLPHLTPQTINKILCGERSFNYREISLIEDKIFGDKIDYPKIKNQLKLRRWDNRKKRELTNPILLSSTRRLQDLTGISANTWGMWFRGERRYNPASLRRMALALYPSVDESQGRSICVKNLKRRKKKHVITEKIKIYLEEREQLLNE